ncbi:hypothetical protein CPB83DRAFT_901605 [Crepidotus variabilis]|uniref:RRM domain-containing protein n=1 Tax=Crepidotus variabilis TaxID=179855 RepID=A0A9P6JVL9_9AGAR|nr:hypothetical protein CPB83DRAFT_901605 [Crepidotus variabilis]
MARNVSAPISSDDSTSSDSESSPLNRLKRKHELQGFEDSDSNDSSSDSDDQENEGTLPTPDEPVLSHKERRKKKKEAEKGPSAKRQKLTDDSVISTKDLAVKRQNSVWVGNLSFKTQHENLKEFFKGVGEITRINMPTRPGANKAMPSENRGFAYVDFLTQEAKTAAIALSEKPLIGRKLLIKDGDSFEGRPSAIVGEDVIKDPDVAQKTHSKTAQKILRSQKQPPGPTLFLGNLPFETTEAVIRELFDAHRHSEKKKGEDPAGSVGEAAKNMEDWIRKIRMGTFEDTGLCKGFAFIDFTTIDNATAALINLKNHHLNGRNLVVQYAGPDAVRRGASKSLIPGQRYKPKPLSAGYKKTRGRKDDDVKGKANVLATEAANSTDPSDITLNPNKQRERKDRTVPSDHQAAPFPRHKGPKSRPKPGAALALAKRETAAIVPSQGKKITF